MKKKIIALSLVALLLVSAGCGCKKKEKVNDTNDKTTANTSEGIVKEQVIDNVKFSNVMVLIKNEQTQFTCDAENQGKKDVKAKYLIIHASDANGEEISKMPVALDDEGIKAGETKQISVATDANWSKAKNVTYEFTDEY